MKRTTDDIALLILRLTVGGNMLLHGIHKATNGVDGLVDLTISRGLPGFLAYGVYLGEVVAPIALILGLVTRGAAAVIAGTMVMAIYLAHAGDIFSLHERTGGWAIELAFLYLAFSVGIALLGGGRFSVDAFLDKRVTGGTSEPPKALDA